MNGGNPFVVSGYDGPDCFCDRVAEVEKLTRAAENGRNVTLLAARRIGKTGLTHHFFNGLKRRQQATVYVDIFATQNLAEFTNVEIDPLTGTQSYSFRLQPLQAETTLKECLDYLGQRGPCVAVIDEFRQIAL